MSFSALLLGEAITSTAASHHPSCSCDVCHAAAGDQAAHERVAARAASAREDRS